MPVALGDLLSYGLTLLLSSGSAAPASQPATQPASQPALAQAPAVQIDHDAEVDGLEFPMEIKSSPGVTLAATLSVPTNAPNCPAVVLVSGSGPQDRDETLLGKKPFAVLTEELLRRGIATLRYDDRGVAESTGDFDSATTFDFADDAAAAVRALRDVDGIGPIGIVGHSEGGLIAPIVATREDDVDFIILLGGPTVPGHEVLARQQVDLLKASGLSDEHVRRIAEQSKVLFDAIRSDAADEIIRKAAANLVLVQVGLQPADEVPAPMETMVDELLKQLTSPWMKTFLAYDPGETLQAVDVPMLLVFGELDLQVSAEQNLAGLATLFPDEDDRPTSLVLPKMNHLFQVARTGSMAEYAGLGESMEDPLADELATWIKALDDE